MKWINDVVFAILAAHVWGSLMLFVWLQAVKRLENKGYTRLLFYLLRAVIVAYLLPLGLGAVLIINEIIEVDARLFQITPVITMISLLLFVIWILGFFANFESLQEKWDMTRHCFSDALPASRGAAAALSGNLQTDKNAFWTRYIMREGRNSLRRNHRWRYPSKDCAARRQNG